MKSVNQSIKKIDSMQLVTGQPVYTEDIAPSNCLVVKLLRSPHANAIIQSINTDRAKKVSGIEAVYTYQDIPKDARRFTLAGQTYPEPSPYDRLLLDRHVRYVGDVVAIVAGANEKCVNKALKLIKVEYEVLEPVLSIKPLTIMSLCTRRITGNPCALWEPTTKETSVHTRSAKTEMWTRC